tara:strand:- start:247 stop:462 length:216 start_codon:yes stop_codon:yes gene_type:complete
VEKPTTHSHSLRKNVRKKVRGKKMNLAKQHRKLHKLLSKAEICLTRDEAKKILKKAAKTQRKLEMGATPTD